MSFQTFYFICLWISNFIIMFIYLHYFQNWLKNIWKPEHTDEHLRIRISNQTKMERTLINKPVLLVKAALLLCLSSAPQSSLPWLHSRSPPLLTEASSLRWDGWQRWDTGLWLANGQFFQRLLTHQVTVAVITAYFADNWVSGFLSSWKPGYELLKM